MKTYLWTLSGILRSHGFDGWASELECAAGDELYDILQDISRYLRADCPDGADLSDVLVDMINSEGA